MAVAIPLLDYVPVLRPAPRGGTMQVFDPVRRRWVAFTPEEHVRQALLHHFLYTLHYPRGCTGVEKSVEVGALTRRFDLLVYGRTHQPWLLAECKAPDVPLSEASFGQLLAYQRTLGCRYLLLSNGIQTLCADAADPHAIQWLGALPAYDA